jgi:hypothetical protein
MSAKLTLIRGDKSTVPKQGGGGGRGRPPSRGRKRSRPNPLNELLWKSTSHTYYRHRANSVQEVAARMTNLSRRVLGRHIEVSRAVAEHCIYDTRRKRLNYGWTLMHVQKGSEGFTRGFVPVLVDIDDEDFEQYLIDDADMVFVRDGLRSSVQTIVSMVLNDAHSLGFYIGILDKQGRHVGDIMREARDDLRLAARRMVTAAESVRNINGG